MFYRIFLVLMVGMLFLGGCDATQDDSSSQVSHQQDSTEQQQQEWEYFK